MARQICDRCPNQDDLTPILGFDLCPACAFDLAPIVARFVATGRVLEVNGKAANGERWAQVLILLERDAEVTSRSLRAATGMSAAAAKDYLHKAAKDKKLVYVKPLRFYLPGNVPSKPEKPKLPREHALALNDMLSKSMFSRFVPPQNNPAESATDTRIPGSEEANVARVESCIA